MYHHTKLLLIKFFIALCLGLLLATFAFSQNRNDGQNRQTYQQNKKIQRTITAQTRLAGQIERDKRNRKKYQPHIIIIYYNNYPSHKNKTTTTYKQYK